ncbi:glycine oxidase ThiO [Coxiella endosymbiont of Amblyomma nuttalli]|uniref:glycine oxidase ThiO n=1 Tax=Coxiella endosymbiont of Amblyomma nuttalli TaxID=2749996 RepID=UPI001BB5FC82|nr:glycine oxidase ThiO [Coxiella endosymbiont of Amblyomma nuttalli]QTS84037.1 tRNA 5-methylaminomethyl-2-thiouridine biosynthesis bifunctional protein MnmC [Coxiella endosymbiont of Amblyomma nuttalli]
MRAGIVGAGLIGRLLAWQLGLAGWHITLFDRGGKDGRKSAAYAAAGMLSPLAECEMSNRVIFDLGTYALKQWPLWLSLLSQPVYFQQRGSIVIVHSNDKMEKERWKKQIQHKIQVAYIKQLSRSILQQLEPELNFAEGYFLPQEAHLDSRALLKALVKDLKKVQWYERTFVEKIIPYRVSTAERQYSFDCVFDCRGIGAGDRFDDLRPVRGELIYLYAPNVNLDHPIRLLHPRYNVYIVPRPNHNYLVGASEIESEDDSPISVRTCLELLSAAYSVHSGFAEARILETVTALRPALSDNLPRIYCEPGLVAINGLYRHGFLLAPAVISEVMRKLKGEVK